MAFKETRASSIIGDVFTHVVKSRHRKIIGIDEMLSRHWSIYCSDCASRWMISYADLMDDPFLASQVSKGPAHVLQLMLKLPDPKLVLNAWDKVTEGYLEDD